MSEDNRKKPYLGFTSSDLFQLHEHFHEAAVNKEIHRYGSPFYELKCEENDFNSECQIIFENGNSSNLSESLSLVGRIKRDTKISSHNIQNYFKSSNKCLSNIFLFWMVASSVSLCWADDCIIPTESPITVTFKGKIFIIYVFVTQQQY